MTRKRVGCLTYSFALLCFLHSALQVHEAYLREHMEEKERIEADHVRVVQEVENQYEHKLALELERYDALSEQVEAMRQECEILLDSAEQAHEAALRDRDEQFAAREAKLKQQVRKGVVKGWRCAVLC